LQENQEKADQAKSVAKFIETHSGVQSTAKAADGTTVNSQGYLTSRTKIIDDTAREEKIEQLNASCPWIPLFVPQAEDATLVEPPKRPPSPFSGRPLRSKDLIPIDLIKETDGSGASSAVKYICPVTRYMWSLFC
jgi:hypothetical protein